MSAVRHHQAGQLDEADRLYRKVLNTDPRNLHALHLRGALAHAAGRNEDAVKLIGRAIAINAQVDVTAGVTSSGVLQLNVGQPTTYVDILSQGVSGANELSNSQFEALTSFALARVIAVASGSLGAVPLPSIGGVSVQNLSIAPQTGYLVVDGTVQ